MLGTKARSKKYCIDSVHTDSSKKERVFESMSCTTTTTTTQRKPLPLGQRYNFQNKKTLKTMLRRLLPLVKYAGPMQSVGTSMGMRSPPVRAVSSSSPTSTAASAKASDPAIEAKVWWYHPCYYIGTWRVYCIVFYKNFLVFCFL